MAVPERIRETVFSEPERTKERIFNAAVELFATKGFHRTSIRDIATAVGMNSANLYHHFKNKEALMLFIMERTAKSVLPVLYEVIEQEKEDPVMRFRGLLKTHLHWAVEHRKESRIFFLAAEELSPEGAMLLEENRRLFADLYDREVRNLQAAGYLKGGNLKIINFNILGVLQSYLRWYRPEGELSFDEVSEEIISFIMGGIERAGTSS